MVEALRRSERPESGKLRSQPWPVLGRIETDAPFVSHRPGAVFGAVPCLSFRIEEADTRKWFVRISPV